MATSDGGPAFPSVDLRSANGEYWTDNEAGMSLRDCFAGLAMAALLTRSSRWEKDDDTADEAYRMADAMLVARARKE